MAAPWEHTPETAALCDRVQKALDVLYNNPNVGEKSQAERWLRALQKEPQAWALPWALVSQDKASEVQFFGALTLYVKISQHWGDIPPDAQTPLRSHIVNLIDENRNGPTMVVSRLCAALAACAVQSAPHGWATPLGDLIAMFPPTHERNILTLFEILAAVAEQVSSAVLPNPRKRELDATMEAGMDQMLSLLAEALGPNVPSKIRQSAFRCLQSWADYRLELEQVRHHVTLAVSSVGDLSVWDEAVECLCTIFQNTKEKDSASVLELLPTILSLRPALSQAIAGEQDDVALGLCRVVTSLCEANVRLLTNPPSDEALNQLLALVTMVLDCTGYPGSCLDEDVSAVTLNFWYILCNTLRDLPETPNKGRLVGAYEPIFLQLFNVLRRKIDYPQNAYTDQWTLELQARFKELRHEYGDTLMYLYGALEGGYMETIRGILQSYVNPQPPGPTWQEVEGAVYCVRAVADYVNMEDDDQSLASVMDLVLQLPRDNQRVTYSALILVGGYAEWFHNRHTHLPHALHMVVPYLTMEGDIAAAAVSAFFHLAEACGEELAGMVDALFDVGVRAAHSGNLKPRDSSKVMQGLVHVVSALPANQILPYVQRLLEHPTQLLDRCLHSEPSRETRAVILHALDQMTNVCKYVEWPQSGSQQAAAATLMQAVVPMVDACMRSWMTDPPVLSACCAFFVAIIRNLGTGFSPFLTQHLITLVECYTRQPQECLLNSAGGVFTMFRGSQYNDALLPYYKQLCAASFSVFQIGMRDHPDVVQAYFSLVAKLVKVNCSLVFSVADAMGPLLTCALMALSLPEPHAMKASANFLVELIKQARGPPTTPTTGFAVEIVNQFLQNIVATVVHCIAADTYRSHLSAITDIAFQLAQYDRDAFGKALMQSLMAADFPASETPLEARQAFAARLMGETRKQGFSETVDDFALVCRNLGNAVGYQ